MLTVDGLREFGADVDSGLARCMKNEAFYLKLVGKAVDEAAFGKLEDAIAAGDLDAAFEAAHSLKGVAGNLSLTPIYEPVAKITEYLRSRTDMDYTELMDRIRSQRERLAKLCV